jgi:hypothetical protein
MGRMRIVLAVLLLAGTASAEPPAGGGSPGADSNPSFSFTWVAPAGCPDRAEVLRRAENLVGHALSRASEAPPVELDATVQPLSRTAWRLNVSSGSRREAQRCVSAGSCDELADAMVLLIALSLDPDYAAHSGAMPTLAEPAPLSNAPPAPESTATPAVTVSPPATAAPSLAPALVPTEHEARPAHAAPRTHLALDALGAVWIGRLPKAAPGGMLGAGLSLEDWVVEGALGFFPAQRVSVQGSAGDISLTTFGSSLGYRLFKGLLTPYAGVELDRLHGVGVAVKTSASGTIWLLGANAGVRVAYPAHAALRLVLDGHLSALAQQARFHIDPNVELFRSSPLAAQFGLGAELRVW